VLKSQDVDVVLEYLLDILTDYFHYWTVIGACSTNVTLCTNEHYHVSQ